MAYVKLDTGILNSTLWIEREQRELFITALLMAEPREFHEPLKQIKVGIIEYTGFEAPPEWYGFVPAASVGIIRRAGVDPESGMEALRALGEPDPDSRSKKFEGRRMIRINGGFAILNYMDYRDKDHTAAERQRRLRERRRLTLVTRDDEDVTRDETLPSRNVTQADADADADTKKEQIQIPSPSKAQIETIYRLYPKHIGRAAAEKAIAKALKLKPFDALLLAVQAYCRKIAREGTDPQYIPHPATWFNQARYEDEEFKPDYEVKQQGGFNGKELGSHNLDVARRFISENCSGLDAVGNRPARNDGQGDSELLFLPSGEGTL